MPDCVRAWAVGGSVELRNPHSTRPWQHVLEPLGGYIRLAAELCQSPVLHGEPFNFGPLAQQNHSVLDLVKEMSIHWSNARWEDISTTDSNLYESGLLKLNCDKALHMLNWHAAMSFAKTIKMTAEWYKTFYNAEHTIRDVTVAQICEYELIAQTQGLALFAS